MSFGFGSFGMSKLVLPHVYSIVTRVRAVFLPDCRVGIFAVATSRARDGAKVHLGAADWQSYGRLPALRSDASSKCNR